MVLLHFEKDGTIKAATIQKPNIIPRVTKVLGTTYKPELAKRYAKTVADFFVAEMSFPENGIYRLDGEGRLCKLDLDKKEWNMNGDEKSKYVISASSDFWKKFDKEFSYLLNFRKELVSIVEDKTTNMFEISPDTCRYIRVDGNQFYVNKADNFALKEVFSRYCTKDAARTLISELMQNIFNTTSYPAFIMINDIPTFALTESSILTNINLDSIRKFLGKYFSPEDSTTIAILAKNSILFGADIEYQVEKVSKTKTKYGFKTDVIYQIAGLHVHAEKFSEPSSSGLFVNHKLLNNTENEEIIKSLKLINTISNMYYYEAYDQGKKVFIALKKSYTYTSVYISSISYEDLLSVTKGL